MKCQNIYEIKQGKRVLRIEQGGVLVTRHDFFRDVIYRVPWIDIAFEQTMITQGKNSQIKYGALWFDANITDEVKCFIDEVLSRAMEYRISQLKEESECIAKGFSRVEACRQIWLEHLRGRISAQVCLELQNEHGLEFSYE